MITNDSVMITAVGAFLMFRRMGSDPLKMEIGIVSKDANSVSVQAARRGRPVGISIDIPVGDRKPADVIKEWIRICKSLTFNREFLEHEVVELYEKSGMKQARFSVTENALKCGYFTPEEYREQMAKIGQPRITTAGRVRS